MALTTVAAVKAYRGNLGSSPALDSLLQSLVDRTSAAIESFIQRSVLSAARVETRDGSGGAAMLLREWPVTAVASVTVNGQPLPASSGYGVAGFRLADGRMLVLEGYRFTKGIQNVVVEYTAGYATVPTDLEAACIEAVLDAYAKRDRTGVQSKSLAGESISLASTDTPGAGASDGFPASVTARLWNYRRVAPLP